jgi:hypothetical protein
VGGTAEAFACCPKVKAATRSASFRKERLHDPNPPVVVGFALLPNPLLLPNPPVPLPKEPLPKADVVGLAPNNPPLVPVFDPNAPVVLGVLPNPPDEPNAEVVLL